MTKGQAASKPSVPALAQTWDKHAIPPELANIPTVVKLWKVFQFNAYQSEIKLKLL